MKGSFSLQDNEKFVFRQNISSVCYGVPSSSADENRKCMAMFKFCLYSEHHSNRRRLISSRVAEKCSAGGHFQTPPSKKCFPTEHLDHPLDVALFKGRVGPHVVVLQDLRCGRLACVAQQKAEAPRIDSPILSDVSTETEL